MKDIIFENLSIMTINGSKVTLNKKARSEFKSEENIIYLLKHIALNKEQSFVEISGMLYLINIITKDNVKYLILTKITAKLPQSTTNIKDEADTILCSKAIFKGFVEKFIALKQRYGGFETKLLYIRFDIKTDNKTQKEIIKLIDNHIITSTRKSDIIGKFKPNEYGMILTNTHGNGIKILLNKIYKVVEQLNGKYPTIKIDMMESTINQTPMMQDINNFDKSLSDAVNNCVRISKD